MIFNGDFIKSNNELVDRLKKLFPQIYVTKCAEILIEIL